MEKNTAAANHKLLNVTTMQKWCSSLNISPLCNRTKQFLISLSNMHSLYTVKCQGYKQLLQK